MERLAKARYPNGVSSRGRVLNEVVVKYLRRIEGELDSRAGVAKLKSFISLTREGMEVIEAGLSVLAPNTLVRSIEKLSGTSHRKAVDKNALIFPEFRLRLSRFGFSMVKKLPVVWAKTM